MFEAIHSDTIAARPEAVWGLWADPARWPEWNDQYEGASADGELRPGSTVTVKYRRGGNVRFEVAAVEPERLLTCEARFPGARLGHEHVVKPRDRGSEISHRLYVRGPLWPLIALLLGRKRMRRAVGEFVERERELVE